MSHEENTKTLSDALGGVSYTASDTTTEKVNAAIHVLNDSQLRHNKVETGSPLEVLAHLVLAGTFKFNGDSDAALSALQNILLAKGQDGLSDQVNDYRVEYMKKHWLLERRSGR
jgi:hypothetical protein